MEVRPGAEGRGDDAGKGRQKARDEDRHREERDEAEEEPPEGRLHPPSKAHLPPAKGEDEEQAARDDGIEAVVPPEEPGDPREGSELDVASSRRLLLEPDAHEDRGEGKGELEDPKPGLREEREHDAEKAQEHELGGDPSSDGEPGGEAQHLEGREGEAQAHDPVVPQEAEENGAPVVAPGLVGLEVAEGDLTPSRFDRAVPEEALVVQVEADVALEMEDGERGDDGEEQDPEDRASGGGRLPVSLVGRHRFCKGHLKGLEHAGIGPLDGRILARAGRREPPGEGP
jgi:hypothetical protein